MSRTKCCNAAGVIPEAARLQWPTEAVDRLIKVAELSGDNVMLKMWQAERESLLETDGPAGRIGCCRKIWRGFMAFRGSR